jgi:hypothetical protein
LLVTYQDHLRRLSQEYEQSYGFGLPWAIPHYQPVDVGSWSLRSRPGGVYESYLAETCVENPHDVLCHNGDAWMSTSMLEIESHAWHLHCSKGNVLIAGLGMGMFLHAVAAKDDVEHVVVLEIDADVIELFKRSTCFDVWQHRDKITILNVDALSQEAALDVRSAFSGEGPDYLYADIWPVFPAIEAPADTRRMISIHNPVSAGWWGQEVEYGLWVDAGNRQIDGEDLASFFKHQGISVPLTVGYLKFCTDAYGAHFGPAPKVQALR